MIETHSILGGRCTIHVGDCIETMRQMPTGSVDCVGTSPPCRGLGDLQSITIELNPDYADIAQRRIEGATIPPKQTEPDEEAA